MEVLLLLLIKIIVNAKNQYRNILSVITLYVSAKCLVTPFMIEKHKTAKTRNKIPFLFEANDKVKTPYGMEVVL